MVSTNYGTNTIMLDSSKGKCTNIQKMQTKKLFNLNWYFIISIILVFAFISFWQGSMLRECKVGECSGIINLIRIYWGFIGLVISILYGLLKLLISKRKLFPLSLK